ncbi:MAG: glycoside hydrolase family 92 protein [Acidobacteria bacterium]|nr:glycoside hydrolase family 92 protein [Acidobacteriota bacterium]
MHTRILPVLFLAASLQAADDPTRHVNVFIGTGGHGHTYPGATLPHGMVQLSPDTYNFDWDWCSGYHYSDSSIMGFSHNHLSGTGVGDLLDFLLMPGTGPAKTEPGSRDNPGSGYRSRFSHSDEKAEPGYYSVLLKDYNIKAELTATERVGFHKYAFPASDTSHFILDLSHAYGGPERVASATLNIVDNTTITGGRQVNAWAKGRHMYFALRFSKPFERAELVAGKTALEAAARTANGRDIKTLVHFKTTAGEVIYVKVALSAVSVEGALRNLQAEAPDWNFDAVRAKAHDAWKKELSRASITTSDTRRREIFYTALYHTLLAPTLFDDVDGQYRGMDNQVHKLAAGEHNYSTYSLWDTYRALHPLYTLMQQERLPSLINCLVRQGGESPAGVPIWPLQGRETFCMTGYHSAPVVAEAMAKGVKGVDYELAYSQLYKRAMQDDYRGLGMLRKYGYIPSDKEEESATKTLEYSYDAWAVAQIARQLGKTGDYETLLGQAALYRNLWDKSTGFIRPRLENGEWAGPFDPKTTGVSKKWRDYTEANSWQATWGAQHDPLGYIKLMGGREQFVAKLDALFTESSDTVGEKVVDMTGLVGQYAHGNEPSHHIAYLYNYAGAPYKTQQRVRHLLENLYGNTPDDGVSGNEDCGQMSAWFVISALGFYAVDPAGGNYVFGTPLFDRAEIEMASGKKLTVEAIRKSPADFYIQSVELNGKPYDKAWFPHSAVANGGKLVFKLGPQPNTKWAAAPEAAPPSMSKP